MTDRDLKKMNRRELLELMIALEEENAQLREQIHQQEVQLQNRTIQIEKAGSMAEAALALNRVFEEADKAAAQYLENVQRRSEEEEKVYERILSEAQQKATEILESAEKERLQKKKEADDYWQEMNSKLEKFYCDNIDLQGLLPEDFGKSMSEKE